MVKVRLSRFGAKKHPYYHIIATDSDNRRDGKFLELLGKYDPTKPMADATLDEARLAYWVSEGAQITVSAARVLRVKKAATAATAAAAPAAS